MVGIRASLLLAATTLLLAPAFATSSATPTARIHANVHRALRKQGAANLIVTLRDSPSAVIESVKEQTFASRGHKITELVDRLESHAAQSQASLDALLTHEATSTASTGAPLFASATRLWISNQVYIRDATFELVDKLAALPSVADVREEEILTLPSIQVSSGLEVSNNNSTEAAAIEWGVKRVKAPAVWTASSMGKGVVVGVIDTGVRATHTALHASYRGDDYSWFDAIAKKPAPYDDNGHGTHVTGTIAGAGGIGVAPRAQWIACKACGVDSCPESKCLTCMQFMLCPTDVTGTNKDCTKAPRVINNSWGGGGGGSTSYDRAINAWLAAEIVPIFAIGNSGPACGTAKFPGAFESVIAVGAFTDKNVAATSSSRGPVPGTQRIKPDITAPGQAIRSAWPMNDNSYSTIGGTSMAAPHVTGVVALALAADPLLRAKDVQAALLGSARLDTLDVAIANCGSALAPAQPKTNVYGHGAVDAVATINFVPPVTPAPTTSAPTPPPTTAAPTPPPTTLAPTPAPKPPVTDRCTGFSEQLCNEMLCEWVADAAVCRSWV